MPRKYKATLLAVQWTARDARTAQKEGWDIFDCSNKLEVEVCTEHPGKFDEGADLDAVHYIVRKALGGSKLHAKAIIHLLIESPDWFTRDIKELVYQGDLYGTDQNGKVRKPDHAK